MPDDSQPFSVHTYLLLFCVCNSNNYDATKPKKNRFQMKYYFNCGVPQRISTIYISFNPTSSICTEYRYQVRSLDRYPGPWPTELCTLLRAHDTLVALSGQQRTHVTHDVHMSHTCPWPCTRTPCVPHPVPAARGSTARVQEIRANRRATKNCRFCDHSTFSGPTLKFLGGCTCPLCPPWVTRLPTCGDRTTRTLCGIRTCVVYNDIIDLYTA